MKSETIWLVFGPAFLKWPYRWYFKQKCEADIFAEKKWEEYRKRYPSLRNIYFNVFEKSLIVSLD